MRLRKLIGGVKLFERGRIATEVRILGIATYIQNLRREERPKFSQRFISFSHSNLEVGKEV